MSYVFIVEKDGIIDSVWTSLSEAKYRRDYMNDIFGEGSYSMEQFAVDDDTLLYDI